MSGYVADCPYCGGDGIYPESHKPDCKGPNGYVDYWTGKDEWFDKYHSHLITKGFSEWWMKQYGLPESYGDMHEYFIRMSFAWMGWSGRKWWVSE